MSSEPTTDTTASAPMARATGSRYTLTLKLAFLAVAVAGAYCVGYWRNRPQAPHSDANVAVQAGFVGFEPAEIELGEQLWGQVIPLELTFTNLGAKPIVIGSVESCCALALTPEEEYEGRVVGPGETIGILASLRTETTPGPKTRSLTVRTTSGDTYVARVTVDVQGTWSLTPEQLDFGEVFLGDETETEPLVATVASDADSIVNIEVPKTPWLEYHVAERLRGESELLFRVRKEYLPPGVSTVSVTINTDCAIKPAGILYVKAKGVYRLVAHPAEVLLIDSEPRVVRFTDRAGVPVHLATVEVSNSVIEVDRLSQVGELEFANPKGVKLREPVAVRVADERGVSRIIYVSVF